MCAFTPILRIGGVVFLIKQHVGVWIVGKHVLACISKILNTFTNIFTIS